MRRPLTLVLRVAVAVALVALVRSVLTGRTGRTAQRSLHGTAPVIGSLDTWPTVPRRPTD